MVIKPFRGLRPRKDLASRIPSYPYDVLSSLQARGLAAGDPYTFLHVEKPEIDLEPEISPYDDRVYAKGLENLRSMIEKGWLARDEKPAYYLYRLVKGDHSQVGIAGIAAVDDYVAGRIKRHENTRPEKETDRTRHIDVLSANAGPILMAYRGIPELNALVKGASSREPDVDFVAPDGIEHALWVVDDPAACERIEGIFVKIPATYVADGHHRAAAAVRVARGRRETNPAHTGSEPYDFFVAVHFPARDLRIQGYQRLVRDLNGLEEIALLDRIRRAGFDIKEGHRARRPIRPRTYGMCLGDRWYMLTARPEIVPAGDLLRSLDVSILTEGLLQPILGIGDARTDRRIESVGGGGDLDEIERRVGSGEFAIGFALHPPRIEDVMKVADAGGVMPPKSTWFEPKLRSGMVVHLLDGST